MYLLKKLALDSTPKQTTCWSFVSCESAEQNGSCNYSQWSEDDGQIGKKWMLFRLTLKHFQK